MAEKKDDRTEERRLLPEKETMDYMRRFVADTAYKLKDEKLLKMLYLRAKTLSNL